MSNLQSAKWTILTIVVAMSVNFIAFAQKPVAPNMIDSNDLLIQKVEGEIRVASGPEDKREISTRKVLIRQITKSRVVVQKYDPKGILGEDVFVLDGDNKKSEIAISVRARVDGLNRNWKWDTTGGIFEGDAIFPRAFEIPIADKDLNFMGQMICKAEDLHNSLETALKSRDKEMIEKNLKEIESIGELATKEKLPESIRNLFSVKSYSESQASLLAKIDAEWKKLQEEKLDTKVTAENIKASMLAREQLSTLQSSIGLAGQLLSDDQELKAALLVRSDSALDDYRQSILAHERNRERTRDLERQYADRAKKNIDLEKVYETERKKLAKRFDLAWGTINVDPDKLANFDREISIKLWKNDSDSAINLYKERAEYLFGFKIAHPTKTAFASFLEMKTLTDKKPAAAKDCAENSQATFALAEKVIECCRWLPKQKEFDRDRTEVLTSAAVIIHRSIAYSVDPRLKGNGPKAWSAAYDPRADFGIRIANAAMEIAGKSGDEKGDTRAVRTWLYFQRGLHARAYAEGQKIETLRIADAESQVNLARIYAFSSEQKNRREKEAIDRFVNGINAGFGNKTGQLEISHWDPDLAAVRYSKVEGYLHWKHYDAPNIQVGRSSLDATPGKASYAFEIKNLGTLPLVNATVAYGKTKTNSWGRLVIPYLAPGDTAHWDLFDVPTGPGKVWIRPEHLRELKEVPDSNVTDEDLGRHRYLGAVRY